MTRNGHMRVVQVLILCVSNMAFQNQMLEPEDWGVLINTLSPAAGLITMDDFIFRLSMAVDFA